MLVPTSCHLLLTVNKTPSSFTPAYYVVGIDHILGPSGLFRCPVTPYIGPQGLDRVGRLNPSAVRRRKRGTGRVAYRIG